MKKRYLLLCVLAFLWVAYLTIASSGRVKTTENIYPRYVIGHVKSYGMRTGHGNIIALSPYLHTYDFSTRESFRGMLHYYLSFARQQGLLNDSTIVVLPEYIGTWLVAANEKKSVYKDTSIHDAMQTMVLSNLFKFGYAYLTADAKDKQAAAVFRMKSTAMRDIYQDAFASVAKEFNVTLVAGSIVLPEPTAADGQIKIKRNGRLYNATAVFGPDGRVLSPLTLKEFPIQEEQAFTAAAALQKWPVYTTPAGRLAVAICADAWYPEVYRKLGQQQIDLLAVPSFVGGDSAWTKRWNGYNGAPTPTDVANADIGTLTEREAWLKYGMTGRISGTNIPVGVNVFLRGDLWKMGSDGHTLLWHQAQPQETITPASATGSLVNIWL